MGDVTNIRTYKIYREALKLLEPSIKSLPAKPTAEIKTLINVWIQQYRKTPFHMVTLLHGRSLLREYVKRNVPGESRAKAEKLRQHVEATISNRLGNPGQETFAPVQGGVNQERAATGQLSVAPKDTGGTEGDDPPRVS